MNDIEKLGKSEAASQMAGFIDRAQTLIDLTIKINDSARASANGLFGIEPETATGSDGLDNTPDGNVNRLSQTLDFFEQRLQRLSYQVCRFETL